MALSASFNYSSTAAQIIKRALQDIGVVVAGESVDSDDEACALERLNDIVKQWSNPADGSEGLKVWLRKFVYLFLGKGDRTYTLGPSGSNATESYSTTTLSAAEAAGQTVLSVTTSTGMTAGDILGVELTTGEIEWKVVDSTGAGTVTVTVALIGAASSGARVFWYTTALAFKPVEILTAVLRDSSNKDDPITVYAREAFRDFELGVSDKTVESDPTALLYEPKRLTGLVTLDSAASDVTKVIRMIVISPADDLDASSDDLLFPNEWFAALEWEVARRVAPVFEKQWTQDRQSNWEQATTIARRINPSGYRGGYAGAQDPDECDPSL